MNAKISTVYCVNPSCPEPKNPADATNCQACEAKLLLNERYQVLGILGKGGFGATFAAIDIVLPGKPICVVKQLRPASNDPQVYKMAKELFIREAQTLGKVGGHPQVPRLLDYFEENQQFYLVQEFVKGNNLHQEVKKRGPFPEAGVKQFLTEILPILDYIHSQKVIHRDIKPANIIRREQDKQLVLIDFGAVKNQVNSVAAGNNVNTALTQFAIGTAGFAPPEQLAMRPVYSSDIYALGITCVYLLTGKSPKDIESDPTTGELLWAKNLDLNESFVKVLRTMLEVNVKQRYKSAKEVLQAMNALPYAESLAEGMLSINTGATSFNKLVTGIGQIPVVTTEGDSSITQTGVNTAQGSRFNRNTEVRNVTSGTIKDPGRTTAVQNTSANLATISGKNSNSSSSKILRLYEQDKKDFAQQQLENLILVGVAVPGIRFSEANLTKSNFQESDLSEANFEKAKLTRAIFKQTILRGAQMNQTDLEGADLRGADLRGANLRSANLKGANFCGANLQNAHVRKDQLVQAKTNWLTVMPSGKRGLW